MLAGAYKAGARGAFDVATINLFTGRPGFVMAAARLTRPCQARREPRKPIGSRATTFPAARGIVAAPWDWSAAGTRRGAGWRGG